VLFLLTETSLQNCQLLFWPRKHVNVTWAVNFKTFLARRSGETVEVKRELQDNPTASSSSSCVATPCRRISMPASKKPLPARSEESPSAKLAISSPENKSTQQGMVTDLKRKNQDLIDKLKASELLVMKKNELGAEMEAELKKLRSRVNQHCKEKSSQVNLVEERDLEKREADKKKDFMAVQNEVSERRKEMLAKLEEYAAEQKKVTEERLKRELTAKKADLEKEMEIELKEKKILTEHFYCPQVTVNVARMEEDSRLSEREKERYRNEVKGLKNKTAFADLQRKLKNVQSERNQLKKRVDELKDKSEKKEALASRKDEEVDILKSQLAKMQTNLGLKTKVAQEHASEMAKAKDQVSREIRKRGEIEAIAKKAEEDGQKLRRQHVAQVEAQRRAEMEKVVQLEQAKEKLQRNVDAQSKVIRGHLESQKELRDQLKRLSAPLKMKKEDIRLQIAEMSRKANYTEAKRKRLEVALDETKLALEEETRDKEDKLATVKSELEAANLRVIELSHQMDTEKARREKLEKTSAELERNVTATTGENARLQVKSQEWQKRQEEKVEEVGTLTRLIERERSNAEERLQREKISAAEAAKDAEEKLNKLEREKTALALNVKQHVSSLEKLNSKLVYNQGRIAVLEEYKKEVDEKVNTLLNLVDTVKPRLEPADRERLMDVQRTAAADDSFPLRHVQTAVELVLARIQTLGDEVVVDEKYQEERMAKERDKLEQLKKDLLEKVAREKREAEITLKQKDKVIQELKERFGEEKAELEAECKRLRSDKERLKDVCKLVRRKKSAEEDSDNSSGASSKMESKAAKKRKNERRLRSQSHRHDALAVWSNRCNGHNDSNNDLILIGLVRKWVPAPCVFGSVILSEHHLSLCKLH